MSFTVEATCGAARAGRVGPLFTPSALLQTQFGQPASLTPVMLSTLGGGGAGIRAGHLIGHESHVASRGGVRIAEYSRLGSRLAVLSQREPSRPPVEATDAGVHLETWGGRRFTSAAEYAKLARVLRADIAITLHDEPPTGAGKNRVRFAAERTAAWAEICGDELAKKSASGDGAADAAPPSVLFYLPLKCEEKTRQVAVARVLAAAAKMPQTQCLGFVVGGALRGISEVATATIASLPASSLRCLPCIGAPADVLSAIRAGVDVFDADYPELLSRFGYAAAWAIDEKDAAARAEAEGRTGRRAADRGHAGFREWKDTINSSDVPPAAAAAATAESEAVGAGGEGISHGPLRPAAQAPRSAAKGFSGGGTGGEISPLPEAVESLSADVTKLDITAEAFIEDGSPLVAGCTCYTCAGTSSWSAAQLAALGVARGNRSIAAPASARRYLHHLLVTQEMLGRVLLTVHNTHHYNRWFEAVRAAISEDRLEEYVRWWNKENTNSS
jgi:queuine/archaeosine tRNA-ribosyltransferase